MIWGYPLVNRQKTMERSTIFNGKSNYFDWAIFNSELWKYQRVPPWLRKLPYFTRVETTHQSWCATQWEQNWSWGEMDARTSGLLEVIMGTWWPQGSKSVLYALLSRLFTNLTSLVLKITYWTYHDSSPNYVKLWWWRDDDKPLDGMNFGHYYTTMFHIIPPIQNQRLLFLCRFLWMMVSLWSGTPRHQNSRFDLDDGFPMEWYPSSPK